MPTSHAILDALDDLIEFAVADAIYCGSPTPGGRSRDPDMKTRDALDDLLALIALAPFDGTAALADTKALNEANRVWLTGNWEVDAPTPKPPTPKTWHYSVAGIGARLPINFGG